MSASALTTFPLSQIIAEARLQCPFYRHLYADLGEDPALSDLPIVESDDFWTAYKHDRQAVLSEAPTNGVVLNSGGTTGTPKFSYFNDEEWDSTVAISARAYEGTGLKDGDRVANLFAAGNLYFSLILATESLKAMRPKVLQFPLAYSPHFPEAAAIIRQFDINVLAGFPTHLLRLIDYLDKEDAPPIHLERILFAGELFSLDQQAFLQKRFPSLSIRSVGYASVDAGMIAYADASCALGEHRVFDGATLVEICDEVTDQPIEEAGQPGRVIFTSLTRRLMPMLRYPSGDLAQWVDPPGAADRKFALLGRSEEAARVSGFTVPIQGVGALLEPFRASCGISEFQVLVTRENLHDRLTLRLVGAASAEALATGTREIMQAFEQWQPELRAEIAAGIVHPIRIEWIGREALITSPRTGKLRRVVDRRAG